jgi:hypothetical protein
MHEPAITDRREDSWKGKIVSQHLCAELAIGNGNCLSRPKHDIIEYAVILAKRDFSFGSAVQVIKDNFRQSPAGTLTKIVNVHDVRRF